MPQIVAGTPYWPAVTPVPNQYPYLAEDIDCDVAVIGGGAAGALCARKLALSGVNTVLADANLIGYGSTSVCASTLQYDIDYGLRGLKELIGAEKAVRAFKACARGVEELDSLISELNADVGYSRRNSFCYSPDCSGADEIREEFLLRRHNGFPVEFYDSMKAADKFSFRVEAGIYTSGLAGEINPYKFTHSLIENAVRSGMRVYENTPVETVTHTASGLQLITRTKHKINCRKAVKATGYRAAKEAGNVANLKTSFCVVTKPVSSLSGWDSRCILRNNEIPSLTLRTTPDGRMVISGLDSSLMDGLGKIGLFRFPSLVERKYGKLEQILISMFTGIGGIEAEYRFSGISGGTADGLPYVGEDARNPDLIYDVCCGSNGIVFGQLAADIVIGLYSGQPAQDADLFCLKR